VAGYTLQDPEVEVYDGKYHPVDSKEIAFVIVGRNAFLDAIHNQYECKVVKENFRVLFWLQWAGCLWRHRPLQKSSANRFVVLTNCLATL